MITAMGTGKTNTFIRAMHVVQTEPRGTTEGHPDVELLVSASMSALYTADVLE